MRNRGYKAVTRWNVSLKLMNNGRVKKSLSRRYTVWHKTSKLVSKCWFPPPVCFGRLQRIMADLFFRFLIGLRSVAKQGRVRPVSPETPCFITTAMVATVAEVESSSTFRETCLATGDKKKFHETYHVTRCNTGGNGAGPLHPSFS